MKTVNIGLLIGVAVLAMVGMAMLATSGAIGGASEYVSFAEAKETGEDVHVVGKWVMQDMANYDNQQDLFSFYMQDSSKNVSLVHYYDPMPVNFKSADKVVVQGKYEGNAFVADRIFMKCPSKYNAGEMTLEEAKATR
ncbi:MAG: cytochrome c maturation protein CcmE [Bacteroidota bacterium]